MAGKITNGEIIVVRIFSLCWLGSACLLVGNSPGLAQNVAGYATIRNPHLFLVREPAVLDDLQLSDQQRSEFAGVNEHADGALLELRGWPADRQNEKLTQLIADSERRVSEILDPRQQQRLNEIRLQVRGIQSVMEDAVVARLGLSAEQTTRIGDTLEQSRGELAQLAEQAQNFKSRSSVEKEARRLREQEQRNVLSILSQTQRSQLQGLIGRPFDISRLGRVKFKAPALGETKAWINSPPTRMADLRGKVIALHFWAFG